MKTAMIASAAGVLAITAPLGAGLSGCSVKVETNTKPAVSASALQQDLTDRLNKAGMAFESVTCNDDLAAEVGKTAGCDVRFSDTNDIEAVYTATKVDGDDVKFDIAPAMTKEQLQKAVSQLSATPTVTCDSGVEGKVGASANCEVTADGITTRRVAEVTGVDPAVLGLELSVVLILDKQEVEDIVAQQMAAESGQAPDSVDCVEDVVATEGTVVECAVTSDGQTAAYDVTVSDVDGTTVNFDVVPQS